MQKDLKTMTNRIEWVDFAKGITMLLVIVAHSVSDGTTASVIRACIYSFHMPLFFILSGLTAKPSNHLQGYIRKTKKAITSLLIPGFLLYFAWTIIEAVRMPENFTSIEFWKMKGIAILFASASSTVLGDIFISGIGMIWFFFVMFLAKMVYDAYSMGFYHFLAGKESDEKRIESRLKWMLLISGIVLTIAGIVIGNYIWLPFSFDIALGIQLFFVMGFWLKGFDLEKNALVKAMVLFVVWCTCYFITYPHIEEWTYLEVGLRRYSLFPVSYLGALAGTLLVGLLGVVCLKAVRQKRLRILSAVSEYLWIAFRFVGRNSFVLLCIHVMDQLWDFIWYKEGHQFLSLGIRMLSDLIVFACVMEILIVTKKVRMTRVKAS